MVDLIGKQPQRRGKKRVTTARAWISRDPNRPFWISNVYVGGSSVHSLSTKTKWRERALDFNRCHLMQALAKTSAPRIEKPHASKQLEFR